MDDGTKIMIVGGAGVDAATAVAMARTHTGFVAVDPPEEPVAPGRDDAFDRLMRWDPEAISPIVIERVEIPAMPFLERGRTWTHPKGPRKEKGSRGDKGRRR